MRLALSLAAFLLAAVASAQRRPRRPAPPSPPSAPALSPMQRVALGRALGNESARNPCIVEALRDPRTGQELRLLSAT